MKRNKVSDRAPSYMVAQRTLIGFEAMKKQGNILKKEPMNNPFVEDRLTAMEYHHQEMALKQRKNMPLMFLILIVTLNVAFLVIAGISVTKWKATNVTQLIVEIMALLIGLYLVVIAIRLFNNSFRLKVNGEFEKKYVYDRKVYTLVVLSEVIMILGIILPRIFL